MAKGVGRGGREDRIRPQPSVRVVFGKIRVGAQLVQAGEPEDSIVAVQEIWDLRLRARFLLPLVVAIGGHEAPAPRGGSLERRVLRERLAPGGADPAAAPR